MHGGESDAHVGEDLIQMRIDMLGNGTQNKLTKFLFYNSVLKKQIFVKFHLTFLLY